jgi:hypothetical protein
VTTMDRMFEGAALFNQKLCWATPTLTWFMFSGSSGSLLSYPACKSTASPTAQPTAQPTARPTSLGPIGATGCAGVTSAFDGSASQSVLYTELAPAAETCAICSGSYDLVATDSSSQAGLSKAVVDASAEVDCSGSRAFATNGANVYSTPLKNQGAMSCVADWNGVFADQAEYSQSLFSVTFAFADLLSTPGSSVSLSPSYSSRLGDPVTIAALTEPQLIVSSITAQAEAGSSAYVTTVQLSLGAQTASCTFPSSIEIVLGSGVTGCRFPGVAMTSTAGQYKWQHTYTPGDLSGCGADASDAQYFKLPMSIAVAYGKNWVQAALPSDATWCFGEKTLTGVARAAQCFGDAAVERPTIASGQSSTILISKSLVSESSSSV